jgi:hypothetical protein
MWYAWFLVARFPRLKPWVDGFGCRCLAAVCAWALLMVSRGGRMWYVWLFVARFPRLKPWVKASASAVRLLFSRVVMPWLF